MQNVCVHPAVSHSWDVQPSPYELGVYAQEKLNKEKKSQHIKSKLKSQKVHKKCFQFLFISLKGHMGTFWPPNTDFMIFSPWD